MWKMSFCWLEFFFRFSAQRCWGEQQRAGASLAAVVIVEIFHKLVNVEYYIHGRQQCFRGVGEELISTRISTVSMRNNNARSTGYDTFPSRTRCRRACSLSNTQHIMKSVKSNSPHHMGFQDTTNRTSTLSGETVLLSSKSLVVSFAFDILPSPLLLRDRLRYSTEKRF